MSVDPVDFYKSNNEFVWVLQDEAPLAKLLLEVPVCGAPSTAAAAAAARECRHRSGDLRLSAYAGPLPLNRHRRTGFAVLSAKVGDDLGPKPCAATMPLSSQFTQEEEAEPVLLRFQS